MSIDWSKAPEGATHWDSRGNACSLGFMKPGLRTGEWEYAGCGGHWVLYGRADINLINAMIPRPAPWSGVGLPPVGTVCEYRWGSVCKQVEIIAHWMAPADLVAVYVPLEDGAHSTECGRAIANAFRPLRTPEQIAAEERLHKIRNAFTAISKDIAPFQGTCGSEAAIRVTVEAMIDAGYLKSEGGAA